MEMQTNQKCAICEELSCAGETRLSSALGDSYVTNATLAISDNFAVIPSVGPLVAGHCLLVTRQHSSNVIAGLDQPKLDELGGICKESVEKLIREFSNMRLFCFEHGSRCELQNSLCSTSHGHLHQLPFRKGDIDAVLDAAGGQKFSVPSLVDLNALLQAVEEYIVAFSLTSDCARLEGIVMDASSAPSQYFRKLIAMQIGNSRWDWKTDGNAGLLRNTLALGFEHNKNIFRERQQPS